MPPTLNHHSMDTYNENEEHRTLTYANSLYSWAMSQMLPLKGFTWASSEIDILKVPEDSRLRYILKVDLEYSKELHDKHNLYSLAPEHVQVNDDMLSPFQQKYSPSIHGCVGKLVPNLYIKEKYVVYYRNFQLYASLGMKIKK